MNNDRIRGWIYKARYARKLGLAGLRIPVHQTSQPATVQRRLPGYDAPLTIRTHTSDLEVFRQIFLEENYRMSFKGFAPKVIVDVGANAGYSAVYFAHQYPDARVLALEPDAENYKTLCENSRPYRNIEPIQAALWGTDEKVHITNPDAPKWEMRIAAGSSDQDAAIDGITINSLLNRLPEGRIDLLKIDIEGSEKAIFNDDAPLWLPRVRMIMIELHDSVTEGCSRNFYRAVTQFPFVQKIRANVIAVRLHDS